MTTTANLIATFPKEKWEKVAPAEAGMDAEKLQRAQQWFASALAEKKGRLAIVRKGRVVLEHHGVSL